MVSGYESDTETFCKNVLPWFVALGFVFMIWMVIK